MEVITLPKDLDLSSSGQVQAYNYENPQGILRARINLNKHTISFLRLGTKEVIGHDTAKQINNQHFLMMKSGNCLMTEKISNSSKLYKSILFFFDDAMALEFLEKYTLTSAAKADSKSFYVFQYDEFIQQFVYSLESLLKLPAKIQERLLKTKFEEIMLYLISLYGVSFLNTIIQNVDDRTSRLTNIVESNKLNRLTLEELAFLCSMSISTFKRTFHKVYHETPMKWFSEQRLNHIATLLRTNQKRPIDLYEEAGYENFSNFVQAFKKRFGVTPKQYQSRNEHF